MAGDFDFLHIKGRTAGSSNELSFDVLDAARAELESGKKRRPSHTSAPNVRAERGAYRGVEGSSALSAAPEVERRKKARRTRSIRIGAIAIVVAAVLVGAGTFFGYRFYQEKISFTGHFNALVGQFVELDRTLVAIDAFVQNPFSSGDEEQVKNLRALVSPTVDKLSGIEDEAQSMKEDVRFDADLASLGEIQVAAKAREEMLDAADGILILAARVQREVDIATTAWNKVIDADQKAREATVMANSSSTEEATIAARDMTAAARDELNEALSTLETLAKEDVQLDFKDQVTYMETRVEALQSAITTSDALLGNDRAAAASANDAYNAKEREAAKLASLLPAIIGDQIEDAYAPDLAKLQDSYRAARSHVSSADASLRGKTDLGA